MKESLLIFYGLVCLFYLAAVFFHLNHNHLSERLSTWCGLTTNTMVVIILVSWSGHAPVFRTFESVMSSSLVLMLLGTVFIKTGEGFPNPRLWIQLETMALLIIALFSEKVPSPSGYDYNDMGIMLFHILRIFVVSLTLISSAYYLQSRLDLKSDKTLAIRKAHTGRNFLLLGAALFLFSEYVGILWCLRGWGDFWQWSGTFLQSTMIVVYFMIVIHLPGSNYRQGSRRPVLGIACGPLVLAMQVIRSVL